MKHTNARKQKTVGVQELSPSEVKKREAEYWTDLRDYGHRLNQHLIAGERYKKDGIIKLAKDLEKAGTIPLHKISARLKDDLKDFIEKRLLNAEYIPTVLEEKYKGKQGPKGGKNSKSQDSGDQSTETTSKSQSQTKTQQQQKTSPTVEDTREHHKLVENIWGHAENLIELLTGYSRDQILKVIDNFQLVSDTKQFRFDLTKRLHEDDLRMTYDYIRRLAMLVDNFVKQLDDESESRKNKEALTSQ